MGGFLGGGQTISTEEQRIGALRIQTSAYGLPIPIIYGRCRVQGNLIWYDDFKAIPHTTTQSSGGGGGKGGSEVSSSNTSYTYTTSFCLGLGEMITGVDRVWKDKEVVAAASTLFNVFTGAYPQSPWGYLATYHPGKDLGYQGLSYVAAANYDLGPSANLPNHSFEVTGALPWNAGAGIYDANPSGVLIDYLSNPHYGACPDGFPTGDLTQFSNWCVASGVFISPAYSEQTAANETITALARIGNAGVFHSEGLLKIVPYGDSTITGNGVTFTPDLTPAYDLTDDDYLENGDEDPVICDRTTPADAFNSVTIEYYDRANDYNIATVEAKDQANIEIYGLRPMPPIRMHEICDAAVARAVAQTILQRVLYIRNTYEFRLGWNYSRLEPMDILTITDANLGMDRAPVRVIEIEEADEEFVVRAEEMLIGTASAALYSHQARGGYSANYQAPSGNINDPVLFEPPVGLTGGRMEIWAAVSGGPLWGGCEVWASDDNATFSRVGYVSGPARHGILTALLPSAADPDTGNTLAVDLTVSRGQLLGVTQAQADVLDTLCWVDGELIGYRDATLTATNKYNLGYLRRGRYGTAIGAHNVNSKFARLDGALVRFPFDANRIGKPIYLKFPSYNIYGVARENLADVPVHTYTLAGSALLAALDNVQNLVSVFRAGMTVLAHDAVTDPVRSVDYEWRIGATWSGAQVLGRTANTEFQTIGDGTYWVSAHSGQAYSAEPTGILIEGGSLTQNVIATYDEAALGWPGAPSGGAVVQAGDIILAGAGNILDAANILSEIDILWYGGVAPAGQYDLPASHAVNIGRVAPCSITMGYTVRGQSIYDNVLTLGDVLSMTDFLGAALGVKVGLQPQIALAQEDGIYAAWQNFVPGSYNAQHFKGRILISSSDPQVTAIVSGLTFMVDVPDRIVEGNVQIPAGGMSVIYSPAFNGGIDGNPVPLPQITVLNAQPGDDVILSAQTLSGFTVQVVNGGAGAIRNINHKEQGY